MVVLGTETGNVLSGIRCLCKLPPLIAPLHPEWLVPLPPLAMILLVLLNVITLSKDSASLGVA